tara:strand:- start:5445 stop:7343 length:1899 start_codon:yes stop_codon:yes gene_type:complete
MTKRFCVLQVTPISPNPEHVSMFAGQEECDFYFVTHDGPNKDALKFCPNTTWTDTRNVLAAEVPKNYEYYAFVDYDYNFRPLADLAPKEQILADLAKYEPAVLTYYPGNGMTTPFAANTEYRDSRTASILPFSHCGMKIVHHSLMNWFFPMVTRFGGGVEACHLFNILEIPFLKNVVCGHQMVYDNGNTDEEAPHNQNGAWNKYRMDEMWAWIMPSFKKLNVVASSAQDPRLRDSLLIKSAFINLILGSGLAPQQSEKRDDYLDTEALERFFDLSHERFLNLDLSPKEQMRPISDSTREAIEEHLAELTFDDFKTQTNPWPGIVQAINDKIDSSRKVEVNECVEIYQQLPDLPSHFHNACIIDTALYEYLDGARVAYVGPAPYLAGTGAGKEIDSYDVVVRIQHGIPNEADYGSRTDIVQSCLNSNYGPPLVKHLVESPPITRPQFVICNDTASQLKPDGTWAFVDEVYTAPFEHLGIPFVHLKNEDGTWDRWALYWQVYPKQHIENFDHRNYTQYTANFNSGYGALNYLMRYPIKELAVFGVDFYNTGIPQTDEQKYNKQYTDTYGASGTPNGPDKILHDQLSQMMHCINVLLKDERFKLDSTVENMLYSNQLTKRLQEFMKLPKFKNETR